MLLDQVAGHLSRYISPYMMAVDVAIIAAKRNERLRRATMIHFAQLLDAQELFKTPQELPESVGLKNFYFEDMGSDNHPE